MVLPDTIHEERPREREEERSYTSAEVERIVRKRTQAIQEECEDLRAENARLKGAEGALQESEANARALIKQAPIILRSRLSRALFRGQ